MLKKFLFVLFIGLLIPMSVKAQENQYKTAIFAGGCFWCMEKPFDHVHGVKDVVVGYSGGASTNPTYQEVSNGGSGHKEVMQVTYDPEVVSYETLLEIFWRNIDPFDDRGQFCDKGEQYMAAIYVASEDERGLAEASKQKMQERFSEMIVTEILEAKTFYLAEDYHQDYYKKNPIRYKFYRGGCRRDKRLEQVWGDEAGGKVFAK